MASPKKHATFEEIQRAVEALVEEVNVLVTAVDDLRCEVEWQARNQAQAGLLGVPVQPVDVVAALRRSEADGHEQSVSATAALGELEASLRSGPRGEWQDDWADEDDARLPEGQVIAVAADLWDGILQIRHAHVIGEGCCCEEGIGAPYLLAWLGPKGEECFLRELAEEEAVALQRLCLAAQAEGQAAASATGGECAMGTTTQRDLF